MSRALEIADQMAKEARKLPLLSDSIVVVWRQQDIGSEIERAIGRCTGSCIVIVDGGAVRPEDTEHVIGPRVIQSYTVALFYAPILKPNGTPIDAIAEKLTTYFDHWVPTESPTDRDVWMRFRNRTAPEADENGFNYQELTFDIQIQFSNQTT